MNTRPDSAASDKGPFLLLSSRFSDWLASVDACLSLTTYQAGRLFSSVARATVVCVLMSA